MIRRIFLLFLRTMNRLRAHALSLTFRQKLMILSLVVIAASYYSAPFGMILLAAGLAAEWRKSPARSVSFLQIARRSVFLLPGIILLVSAVAGPLYFGHTTNAGLGFFILAPLLFCMTAIEVLWQKEDSLHFARYAAILMVPLALIAFLREYRGGAITAFLGSVRVSSTFSNPNYFSYILEIVLLFSIALFYHLWKKHSRIHLMISTLFSLLCLYFTGSRTGMLAFLAGLTVFYLCMSEKKILVVLFGTITLTLIAVALFPEAAVSVFRDLIPRPESFLSEIENRFLLWSVAWKQIVSNPVMGTGLDSYRLLIPKNAPAVLLNSMHCHNIFLNLWLETGLFGVLSFVWISLRAAFTAVRRLQYSSVRPCLSAGIGMVAATFIHGIMDASLVSSQTLSYFGLFLACLVVMNRKTVNF